MSLLRTNVDVNTISALTIVRLSIYLRCVERLASLGIETISSQELARRFNLNPAQIRKDFAYFGEFGVRGVGYNVIELRSYLREILGLDREHRLVIVGVGNLAMALANYSRFTGQSFLIVGMLDANPDKIGMRTPNGLMVEDAGRLADIVIQRNVEIGVITTPASAAQKVCDDMASSGLKTILNFAPVQVKAPDGVLIRSVDLRVYLEELAFYLTHGIPEP